MANDSIDRKKFQRFDEWMKIFHEIKQKWPRSFDNVFLPYTTIAVNTLFN